MDEAVDGFTEVDVDESFELDGEGDASFLATAEWEPPF